jgi:hypothetical protein
LKPNPKKLSQVSNLKYFSLKPQNTNLMLQEIYKVASSGKNSDAFVKKILGGGAA